jgi:hypothetical protein
MTRPETGPMKFGDDWTGVFIRGDDAFAVGLYLRNTLDAAPPELGVGVMMLRGLQKKLEASDERNGVSPDCQRLRAFEECARPRYLFASRLGPSRGSDDHPQSPGDERSGCVRETGTEAPMTDKRDPPARSLASTEERARRRIEQLRPVFDLPSLDVALAKYALSLESALAEAKARVEQAEDAGHELANQRDGCLDRIAELEAQLELAGCDWSLGRKPLYDRAVAAERRVAELEAQLAAKDAPIHCRECNYHPGAPLHCARCGADYCMTREPFETKGGDDV